MRAPLRWSAVTQIYNWDRWKTGTTTKQRQDCWSTSEKNKVEPIHTFQNAEDKAEQYAASQSAAKTGMAQWTSRRILLKTELIIFFFLVMYAKLVARRSMARHSMGRSPMAWTTIEEVSRNSMELSNLSEKKLIMLLQVEQLRRDQLLLHDHLSKQNRDLREAHMKSLHEMEELKRFQGSRFDEFSRIILI